VILIGIDGLMKNCTNQNDLSAFEIIMKEGSYSFNTRTSLLSSSASGWTGILCGMDSEDTGVYSELWWAPWMYGGKRPDITPVTGVDTPFPCIFSELKRFNNKLKVRVTYDWGWFINFGNISIPGSMDSEDYCDPEFDLNLNSTLFCDAVVLNNTINYIKDDFDFIFSYFRSADTAGHTSGFCSDKYIDNLSKINTFIQIIFDELKNQEIYENTYVIIATDHGADNLQPWHGEWNDENLQVPLFIKGPNVKKNYNIQSNIMNIDIPSTIIKFFNSNPNPIWRGNVINEIFVTKAIPENERLYKNRMKNQNRN
jgi:hypothetical protein